MKKSSVRFITTKRNVTDGIAYVLANYDSVDRQLIREAARVFGVLEAGHREWNDKWAVRGFTLEWEARRHAEIVRMPAVVAITRVHVHAAVELIAAGT